MYSEGIRNMIEQLQRTKENWTYGIINIPLLYGSNNRLGVNPRTILRKVAHNAKCYHKPFPCLDKRYRYLWFELDVNDTNQHQEVLNVYHHLGIDVYWHKTMKGYHYITMTLFDKADYDYHIMELKTLFDNLTFSYSLRIIPNKWINESGVWYNGAIINNGSGHIKQLQYIENAINKPYVFNYNRTIPKTVELLDNMFCISRYEFKKGLKV